MPFLTLFLLSSLSKIFASHNDLIQQLPVIKKKAITHKAYANLTLDDMFDLKELKGFKQKQVTTLKSSILSINETGEVELKAFPKAFQTLPIYAFASFQNKEGDSFLMAVGILI